MTHHKIIIGDSRRMQEIADDSVHLMVTSPPYWQLKDYGVAGQIGYNDSYEEYINNLNRVWSECYRVLHPGCRMCINIGDQFARSVFYGRYKVIPIRTEIIKHCETIGCDYMGAIIWQKATTCHTTGGATVMGSYPYPRSGIIKIDYEFILIFKKLGRAPRVSKEIKEQSKLTAEEWNEYFYGHWDFPGEKQDKHLSTFPEELPKRLIKMFTFVGDTVLDPFLGSGTVTKVAKELRRNSIGYEINPDFLSVIKDKVDVDARQKRLFTEDQTFEVIFQQPSPDEAQRGPSTAQQQSNSIQRLADPKQFRFKSVISIDDKDAEREPFYKVAEIRDVNMLKLDTGLQVKLIGLQPFQSQGDDKIRQESMAYLRDLFLHKKVILKFDAQKYDADGNLLVYAYLPNKTFINGKILKSGYAFCDRKASYSLQKRFISYEQEARQNGVGLWARVSSE